MYMWHHSLTSKLKINESCSRNPTSRKRVHFIFSGFYITYVNLPEHVITEHVVAISLKMWWLLSWRCCGYFVEDVVATWLEMWWLVGCRRVGYMVVDMCWLRSWICGGYMARDVVATWGSDVVATWLEMWWLLVWRYGCYLVVDMVATWLW